MKFSALLSEYLQLRDDENEPGRSEYEPIFNRSRRHERMRELEDLMDSMFSKESKHAEQ